MRDPLDSKFVYPDKILGSSRVEHPGLAAIYGDKSKMRLMLADIIRNMKIIGANYWLRPSGRKVQDFTLLEINFENDTCGRLFAVLAVAVKNFVLLT